MNEILQKLKELQAIIGHKPYCPSLRNRLTLLINDFSMEELLNEIRDIEEHNSGTIRAKLEQWKNEGRKEVTEIIPPLCEQCNHVKKVGTVDEKDDSDWYRVVCSNPMCDIYKHHKGFYGLREAAILAHNKFNHLHNRKYLLQSIIELEEKNARID